MKNIIIIVSLLLDGLLSVKIPVTTYFLPLLTLTSIFLIYPKYKKQEKRYFTLLIIVGLIYDILYTNLLFFHATIFFFLGILTKYIYKNYHQNIIKQIIYLIIIIAVYEVITALILFIFQATTITIGKIIEKIAKSLILNIVYALLIIPPLKIKNN